MDAFTRGPNGARGFRNNGQRDNGVRNDRAHLGRVANGENVRLDVPKVPQEAAGSVRQEKLSRHLDWPECSECTLPSRALFSGICVQCKYLDLVRQERGGVGEVAERLRRMGLCAYCGEYASDIEHVIPRSSKLATYTVPACQECNGIAGGKLFLGFDEKQTFIRNALKKKYRKVLAMPEWDEEEVEEMGRAMSDMIRVWRVARLSTIRRLAWEPRLSAFLASEAR